MLTSTVGAPSVYLFASLLISAPRLRRHAMFRPSYMTTCDMKKVSKWLPKLQYGPYVTYAVVVVLALGNAHLLKRGWPLSARLLSRSGCSTRVARAPAGAAGTAAPAPGRRTSYVGAGAGRARPARGHRVLHGRRTLAPGE